MADTKYTANDIELLSELEGVRKRPGMYIGSTNLNGLHHLVWEVIDNSVDEAVNGYGKKITVTLMRDGSLMVEDEGRGVPVDIHKATGMPAQRRFSFSDPGPPVPSSTFSGGSIRFTVCSRAEESRGFVR